MKISVIVPIYNVEAYLRRAVDSIISQKYNDLEIILINDGSPDNCSKIIDEYQSKDSRIITVHKDNKGYGHTVNTGLDIATGDYIAILEPDDFIDKVMYSELSEIAAESEADVVKSGYYENLQTDIISEEKRIIWRNDIPELSLFKISDYPYFFSFHPSIWTCLYKRSFLEDNKIRFVEAKGAGWTDNLFQIQTLCLANAIIYTSSAYYHWSRFSDNASDELSDFRIPFFRSQEIHNWLKQNNITDPNVLAAIYRRELAYIRIVKGMSLSFDDSKSVSELIYKMCYDMDKDIVLSNYQFKEKEKTEYLAIINKSYPGP